MSHRGTCAPVRAGLLALVALLAAACGTDARPRPSGAATPRVDASSADAAGESPLDAAPRDAPDGSADARASVDARADATERPDATLADAAREGAAPEDAGDGGREDPDAPDGAGTRLALAIERALAYARSITTTPTHELVMQYPARRHRLPGWEDALARYDAASGGAQDRVFRRVLDRTTRPSAADLDALTGIDAYTSAALYCDVRPLPPDYAATLGAAAALGGYELTHVLLALVWAEENGCPPPLAPAARAAIESEVARLAGTPGPPPDLVIEAEAFLHLVGRRDLLHPELTDAILRLQLDDGGFPVVPGSTASDFHPTSLALWVLLGVQNPEAPLVPLIAPG